MTKHTGIINNRLSNQWQRSFLIIQSINIFIRSKVNKPKFHLDSRRPTVTWAFISVNEIAIFFVHQNVFEIPAGESSISNFHLDLQLQNKWKNLKEKKKISLSQTKTSHGIELISEKQLLGSLSYLLIPASWTLQHRFLRPLNGKWWTKRFVDTFT